MVVNTHVSQSLLPFLLVFISGVLIIAALAGPTVEKIPQPVFKQQTALVIILDLSKSMLSTDLLPNRVTRAKHKVLDILNQRTEGLTSLVVFAGDAYAISPLTEDALTITSQVNVLSPELMPTQGSRLDRGLKKAVELLAQGQASKGHILILTDGISGSAKSDYIAALPSQHTVSIIGVGTAQGAPIPIGQGGFVKDTSGNIIMPKLDIDALSNLAAMGAGTYRQISTADQDLHATLTPFVNQSGTNEAEKTEFTADLWRELGPWLLLPILLLSSLSFRKGLFSILIVLMLPYSPTAEATWWDNLWQRPDQQAQMKFNQGHVKQAAEQFNNPGWKAAAHYRAEEYEQTLKTLANQDSAQSFYNQGNALTKLGKYKKALAHYDKALEKAPDMENAKYNRDSVKKWLEKQEQQQKNKNDQQSKDQKQDDQQNSEQDASDKDKKNQNSSESEQQSKEQDPSEEEQQSQKKKRRFKKRGLRRQI